MDAQKKVAHARGACATSETARRYPGASARRLEAFEVGHDIRDGLRV